MDREVRRFLNLIDKAVPDHLAVHVVVDNSSTHKAPTIQRWLVRHPRFALHLTDLLELAQPSLGAGLPSLTASGCAGRPTVLKELTASIRTWVAY